MSLPRYLPLPLVAEQDGQLTSFLFRGETQEVRCILKCWSRSRYGAGHAADITFFTVLSESNLIATVVRDNLRHRWYLLRVMD